MLDAVDDDVAVPGGRPEHLALGTGELDGPEAADGEL